MEQNRESQKQKHEKPKKEEPKKPGFFSKMKDRLVNYRRVISIARKPDNEEFGKAVKITGSGILFVGFIGFTIFLIYYVLSGGVAL